MRQLVDNKRIQSVFVLTVFAALFVFALFAWFERMNSDAGYYLFRSINKQWFHVEHGRYVLALAELLPLLGTWLHLPLKAVVVLYSVNHVLLFIAAAWISFTATGSLQGPVMLAFLAFAGLHESIFTPQFELYYGLVFLVLFLVLLNQGFASGFSIGRIAALVCCAFFAVTSHPMALVNFAAALFINELIAGRKNTRLWIVFGMGLVLFLWWKKATVSDYEGNKFSTFLEAIRQNKISQLCEKKNWLPGIQILWQVFPDILLCFFISTIAFVWIRKPLILLVYLCSVLFCLLTVWLVWNPDSIVTRYLEQVYNPWVFSVTISMFWLLPRFPWLILVLLLSLVFRVGQFKNGYNKFHNRTLKMDYFISEAAAKGGQRYCLTRTDMGDEAYRMADWSYGFETMVRSKITTGNTISITKDEDLFFEKNDSLLRTDEYLFRQWEREKTSSLNRHYFQMKPGRYELLFPRQDSAVQR